MGPDSANLAERLQGVNSQGVKTMKKTAHPPDDGGAY